MLLIDYAWDIACHIESFFSNMMLALITLMTGLCSIMYYFRKCLNLIAEYTSYLTKIFINWFHTWLNKVKHLHGAVFDKKWEQFIWRVLSQKNNFDQRVMALNESVDPERNVVSVRTYPNTCYVQLTTYHSVVHKYSYSHRNDSRNHGEYNPSDTKIDTDKICFISHTFHDQLYTSRDMSYEHSGDTDITQAIVWTSHAHNFFPLEIDVHIGVKTLSMN